MIGDDEPSRDLAALVVPQAGRLIATGGRYEPYRLVDADGVVRAENVVHGSDQQSCSPDALPVMITGHVPAVRLPSHHAGDHVVAAIPA